MRTKILRVLWVAITPLALLVLTSTVQGSDGTEAAGGHDAHGAVIQNWADPGYKAKHLPPPFAAAWLNFAAFAAILLKLVGPGLARMARERHDVLARAIAEGTRLFTLAESLGGVESLIEVPAAMTHASVAGTQLDVDPALIRLSVGIEGIDDLIADLTGALDRA